jgi:hypothetical protein
MLRIWAAVREICAVPHTLDASCTLFLSQRMDGSFTPVEQVARSLHLRMLNQPEFMRVPVVSGESWADFKERAYKAYYTVKGLKDDAISAMVGDTVLFLVPANVDEPEDPAIATAVSVEANRLRGGKKLGPEHFDCYVVATGERYLLLPVRRPPPHPRTPPRALHCMRVCHRDVRASRPRPRCVWARVCTMRARPLPPLTRAPFFVLFTCRCWRRR